MALHGRAARAGARAPAAGRLPAVRGGRRPALVARRRRAAACGPGSPTTCSGCPTSRTTTWRSPAITPCSTSRCRSWRARRSRRERRNAYFEPEVSAETRAALRALRAGARPQPGGGPPRPAADGQRRLERRHEPGRRGRPGRERLAGLVPRTPTSRASPASPRRAARRTGRARWRAHATRSEGRARARRRGTATGTGARYFDDGTPLGSAVNDECRIDSIAQSWGVISGAADPERAPPGHGRGGRAPRPAGRRARAALHAALRPGRRSIPATSRATCPACARTAGSTPTRRCGP